MSYQIEVLIISPDLVKSVQSACDSLNKVQDEFEFKIPKVNLRSKLYTYHRDEYKADDVFLWIEDYRNDVKGNRPYIILIVDGFLSSNKSGNLFGTINRDRNTAVFTTDNFDQFVNDKIRFCRYYLSRYAINFLAPSLRSHDLPINKDCIFHYKRDKREIALSLNSGHICDSCREIMQYSLTSQIDEAVKKLLLVVSNQHPYSIVLKGGGVKGLAFAGALLELENYFSFDAFAGTSAGAIAAVLLGAGYKPSELLQELWGKNFNDFRDASFLKKFFNFLIKKGFYPGDEIENWINKLLRDKIKSKVNEIQLCDLISQTIVYASRIKDGTIVFDSHGQRKEAHAAYAARCSMSIPYFFFPKQVDGVRVYDGGLRNNFPLKRFVDDNKQKPFIGLYLKSGTKKSRFVINELINTAIDGEEMQTVDANIDKIVIIDTHPIRTTDFNLNEDKKKFLVLAGKVGALHFINTNFSYMNIDKLYLLNLETELELLRKKITN